MNSFSQAGKNLWKLNSRSQLPFLISGGRLIIKRIQKKHAGIYQCFATNAVGTTYGSAMIQVSPIQVTQVGSDYLPDVDEPDLEGKM